ncbi:MAG: tRNA uridine-5-carboxymethylaminomethyl(34) synthesis enzyme MnmG [Bacteroidia bacterium]|nr:tRNA uridine-5-carboxymethylaminomethyl(34) synthesis enzyme MnmG [Bacteroidia bacterium]
MNFDYDVIVVGAGHAGCEAARAAAKLGSRTLLITMDMAKIAQMSCNPAIGGIAKGQIVREIDALGGGTAYVTDRSSLQFRMLNLSKGPAMWSPRSQCDFTKFILNWRYLLEQTENLNIWQDTVSQLIISNNKVIGLKTSLGAEFKAKSVVLTNGTFLNGLIHVGKVQLKGGRMSEPASTGLTEQLISIGFTSQRMKTGTPVRIDIRSVDLSQTEIQNGDCDFHKFSYLDYEPRNLNQLPCYLLNTNEEVHNILRSGIKDSPLYNGQIKSIGPRYCPSIETKIITFPDKQTHPLFLEPESEGSTEYYLNGFSSSLPMDIQINALQAIPAFKNIHIFRPGYAIEYDYFEPTQLTHSLETKQIQNLFFAGQINGTTGYEEAAGQGLIAGINAHQKCNGEPEFTLQRNEAYIGVLIDDLVTKGVDEPYRMFTSRAEYRILLRQDDADARLTTKSHKIGLADNTRYQLWKEKEKRCAILKDFLETTTASPAEINPLLERLGNSPIKQGTKYKDILLRPDLSITKMAEELPSLRLKIDEIQNRKEEISEAVEISVKYAGYISREKIIADKLQRLEEIKIKGKFDYSSIQAITIEARQKLTKADPETIAQAARIPGISPSDINILLTLMGR